MQMWPRFAILNDANLLVRDKKGMLPLHLATMYAGVELFMFKLNEMKKQLRYKVIKETVDPKVGKDTRVGDAPRREAWTHSSHVYHKGSNVGHFLLLSGDR